MWHVLPLPFLLNLYGWLNQLRIVMVDGSGLIQSKVCSLCVSEINVAIHPPLTHRSKTIHPYYIILYMTQ